MKRVIGLGYTIIFSWLLANSAIAQQSVPGNTVQAGERLAIDDCAACHMVSSRQPRPPIMQPPAPSFRAIANRPNTTAKSLRAFILTTHTTLQTPPNMPSTLLSDNEATAAVAYILSLKSQ